MGTTPAIPATFRHLVVATIIGPADNPPMPPRPKPVLARDAYLAVMRAHERLASGAATLFKAHGLTQPQFNVLRILRGAPPEGLPCQAIGQRLVTRVPDVTRLLDRMEDAGLVTRERSRDDRRVVLARLTPDGRRRVDALDEPVLELHAAQAEGLKAAELETLEALLDRLAAARGAVD